MSDELYLSLIYGACLIGGLMVVLPAVVYLFTGWVARRERIITTLNARALKLYYAQYFPSVDISGDSDDALCRRFAKHYGRRYGRRRFVIPLALLAAVAFIAGLATAETVSVWQDLSGLSGNKALPPVALSALLGGVMWVVSDQLSRFASRDFTSADVSNGVFRLLISVPFGYSLQTFANPSFGIPLAFLIGAFPTKSLFTIARRLGGQKLGLGEEAAGGKLELENLQDISRTNAERFQDEGISTVAELAWVDPIDPSIRSNRDFNYVVDCMSQALIWIYFGPKMPDLAKFSIRGAQEVEALVNTLIDPKPDAQKLRAAQECLTGAAAVLDMKSDALLHTLLQVKYDPYTQFLSSIWS